MRHRHLSKFVVGCVAVTVSLLTLPGAIIAPPAARSRDPHANVLPGRGIGRVLLGMRQADVRGAVGKPQSTYYPHLSVKSGLPAALQGEYVQDEWLSPQGKYQLDVTYRRGCVVQIATTNPAYAAEGGISVGSTSASLRRRFPRLTIHCYSLVAPSTPPDEATSYYVDSVARGIGFEFGIPDNTSFADTVATTKPDALLVHPAGTPVLPIYGPFVGERFDAADLKQLRAYFHG